MRISRLSSFIILILITMVTTSFAQKKSEADLIIGTWLVESKEAKVKIYKKNNKYYGKIVWLKNPTYEDGTEKIDKNNPDENLRSRKLMGLLMLRDFVYDDDLEWDDGEIYDPKTGNTYSCYMTLEEDGTLEVRGYIGISLIGRTQIWTKVEE